MPMYQNIWNKLISNPLVTTHEILTEGGIKIQKRAQLEYSAQF